MSNYSRGVAFERHIMSVLTRLGWSCTRSAGSHGPADVVAGKSGRHVYVQCKLNGRLPAKERDELIEFAANAGAEPVLACKDRHKDAFYRLEGGTERPRRTQITFGEETAWKAQTRP